MIINQKEQQSQNEQSQKTNLADSIATETEVSQKVGQHVALQPDVDCLAKLEKSFDKNQTPAQLSHIEQNPSELNSEEFNSKEFSSKELDHKDIVFNEPSSKEMSKQEFENAVAYEELFKKADKEFKEITATMNQEETETLKTELLEIAQQEPNITSVKTLNYIRLAKKAETEKNLETESWQKNKLKSAGTFPASTTKNFREDLAIEEIIRDVDTIEQLKAYEKELAR